MLSDSLTHWYLFRDDGSSGEAVSTTIEFRGQQACRYMLVSSCITHISDIVIQAKYTFPIGVTTLWWYAPNTSNNGRRTDAVNATRPLGNALRRASMVKRHRKFHTGSH